MIVSWWNLYRFGPIRAIRPQFATRLTLALLAFDIWLLMLAGGGRYGAGDFNVTHFAWLDGIQPIPQPAFYVGLLTFVGLLALATALSGPTRGAMIVVFLGYTYSWVMSLLDAYQHHYLLSLLLFCMIFFNYDTPLGLPNSGLSAQAKNAKRPQPTPRTQVSLPTQPRGTALSTSWAYGLFCVTVAIVYTFTAVTKLSPAWRDGSVLRHLAPSDGRLHDFADWLQLMGLPYTLPWPLLAGSIGCVQVVLAITYLVAPLRDRSLSGPMRRVRDLMMGLGFVLAVCFHLSVGELGLRIGWFSYYMVGIACVTLLPAQWLEQVWRILATPFGHRRVTPAPPSGQRRSIGARMRRYGRECLFALVLVAFFTWVGVAINLPGVAYAIFVGGIAYIGWTILQVWRGDMHRWPGRSAALAASALSMWACMTFSDLRWRYYRFVG